MIAQLVEWWTVVAEHKIANPDGDYHTPWQIATLFTRAGIKDRAITYLKKALEVHDPNMPYLGVDPIFDILRDEPEFMDILEQMNLIQFINNNNHESN